MELINFELLLNKKQFDHIYDTNKRKRNGILSNLIGQRSKMTKLSFFTQTQSLDDDEVLYTAISFTEKVLKNSLYVESVVSKLRDCDFKSHFRLSRQTVELLFQLLIPSYGISLRCSRHDPKKQILIGLWYFANQESYRQISDRFDVSLGSAIAIINCMVDKICEKADRFIIWPKGNKLNDTVEGFTSLRTNAFPKVLGAIDGAHIKILAPWTKRNKMPPLDRNSYINRKQVATVLLQGICDSEYKFINIFSGWPGSAHDAHVFKNSPVGEQLITNSLNLFPRDMHILGDCAYPLLHCLMTPYRDNGHLTREQRHFNYKLSSSRIVIEQSFGKLFGRFRRLRFLDVYDKTKCAKFITTCVCLHNICMDSSDDWSNHEVYTSNSISNNQDTCSDVINNKNAGKIKRDAICRYFDNFIL